MTNQIHWVRDDAFGIETGHYESERVAAGSSFWHARSLDGRFQGSWDVGSSPWHFSGEIDGLVYRNDGTYDKPRWKKRDTTVEMAPYPQFPTHRMDDAEYARARAAHDAALKAWSDALPPWEPADTPEDAELRSLLMAWEGKVRLCKAERERSEEDAREQREEAEREVERAEMLNVEVPEGYVTIYRRWQDNPRRRVDPELDAEEMNIIEFWGPVIRAQGSDK